MMAADGDMNAHEGTYGTFLWLLKWGSIITAILTAFVIFLIAG